MIEGQSVVAILPGPRIKDKGGKHWENIVVLTKITILNKNYKNNLSHIQPVIQKEVSQKEKNKYRILTRTCGI